MSMRGSWIGFAMGLALSSTALEGLAQPAPSAQALFDEGLRLMREQRFTDACPLFERSQKMDPAMGTKYRLAECQAGLGKLATAWTLFIEVASDAKQRGQTDRETQAREQADKLRPRLPRIIVSRASLPTGARVKINGSLVQEFDLDQPIPVDPGKVALMLETDGKKSIVRELTIAEQETKSADFGQPPVPDATVSSSGLAPEKPIAGRQPEPSPSDGPSSQLISGLVVGGVGVVAVGVGAALGFMAKATWDDALAGCNAARTRCDATGVSTGEDASAQAAISTGLFIGGGVLGATGLVLVIVSPEVIGGGNATDEPSARAWLAPTLGGASIKGEF